MKEWSCASDDRRCGAQQSTRCCAWRQECCRATLARTLKRSQGCTFNCSHISCALMKKLACPFVFSVCVQRLDELRHILHSLSHTIWLLPHQPHPLPGDCLWVVVLLLRLAFLAVRLASTALIPPTGRFSLTLALPSCCHLPPPAAAEPLLILSWLQPLWRLPLLSHLPAVMAPVLVRGGGAAFRHCRPDGGARPPLSRGCH